MVTNGKWKTQSKPSQSLGSYRKELPTEKPELLITTSTARVPRPYKQDISGRIPDVATSIDQEVPPSRVAGQYYRKVEDDASVENIVSIQKPSRIFKYTTILSTIPSTTTTTTVSTTASTTTQAPTTTKSTTENTKPHYEPSLFDSQDLVLLQSHGGEGPSTVAPDTTVTTTTTTTTTRTTPVISTTVSTGEASSTVEYKGRVRPSLFR